MARTNKAGDELVFDEKRAAQKLNLSDRTLRRLRKQSLITFFRVGTRVLYSDECLKRFLEDRRQGQRQEAA